MRKELTTPQLREAVEHILAQRSRIPSDAILLTRLLPTLVDCDGPGRSLEFAYDTQPWMTNPMGMVLYCGSTTAQVTAEIYLPEQPDRVLVSASGVYFTKPLPGKEK